MAPRSATVVVGWALLAAAAAARVAPARGIGPHRIERVHARPSRVRIAAAAGPAPGSPPPPPPPSPPPARASALGGGIRLLEWTPSQQLLVKTAKFVWNALFRVMLSELAPQSSDGAYVRPAPQRGSSADLRWPADLPAERGRYHLYAGNACPWCHRALIVASVRGLLDGAPGLGGPGLGVSSLTDDAERASRGGWCFDAPRPAAEPPGGAVPDGAADASGWLPFGAYDPLVGAPDLRGVYDALCAPGLSYRGRCTAPLLVDLRGRTGGPAAPPAPPAAAAEQGPARAPAALPNGLMRASASHQTGAESGATESGATESGAAESGAAESGGGAFICNESADLVRMLGALDLPPPAEARSAPPAAATAAAESGAAESGAAESGAAELPAMDRFAAPRASAAALAAHARRETIDLYPPGLRAEIDELNAWIYEGINNGVYRCGFASSQRAYDQAESELHEALRRLDALLADGRRFVAGDVFTEADARLLPTAMRFDAVYAGLFRCGRASVRAEYTHVHAWLRRAVSLRGLGAAPLASTLDVSRARASYHKSLFPLNPSLLVAAGPSAAQLGIDVGAACARAAARSDEEERACFAWRALGPP